MANILGNVLWLVYSFYVPIFYLIFGLILFPLLPWLFPLVRYSFWPYGKTTISKADIERYRSIKKDSKISESILPEDVPDRLKLLANVIWLLVFGWMLALMHICAAVIHALCFWQIVTIPGIAAHIAMIPVALAPFNKVVVSTRISEEIRDTIEKDKLGI